MGLFVCIINQKEGIGKDNKFEFEKNPSRIKQKKTHQNKQRKIIFTIFIWRFFLKKFDNIYLDKIIKNTIRMSQPSCILIFYDFAGFIDNFQCLVSNSVRNSSISCGGKIITVIRDILSNPASVLPDLASRADELCL